MRNHRLVRSVVLAATLSVTLVANASASGPNCVGTFASDNAGPGFGNAVAAVAQVARPLGRNVVGPAASSNDCAAFPSP